MKGKRKKKERGRCHLSKKRHPFSRSAKGKKEEEKKRGEDKIKTGSLSRSSLLANTITREIGGKKKKKGKEASRPRGGGFMTVFLMPQTSAKTKKKGIEETASSSAYSSLLKEQDSSLDLGRKRSKGEKKKRKHPSIKSLSY